MDTNPQEHSIRIELTDEQKEKLRRLTSRDVDALELSVTELEERVAPLLSKN